MNVRKIAGLKRAVKRDIIIDRSVHLVRNPKLMDRPAYIHNAAVPYADRRTL